MKGKKRKDHLGQRYFYVSRGITLALGVSSLLHSLSATFYRTVLLMILVEHVWIRVKERVLCEMGLTLFIQSGMI
jgi:hypothetical protein